VDKNAIAPAAEPKRKLLGPKKATAPGKSVKAPTSFEVILDDDEDDFEEDKPIAIPIPNRKVAATSKASMSKNNNGELSPKKRSRKVIDSDDEEESDEGDVDFVQEKSRPAREKAKAVSYRSKIIESEDEDFSEEDDDDEQEASFYVSHDSDD
jgi:hypothetical protein